MRGNKFVEKFVSSQKIILFQSMFSMMETPLIGSSTNKTTSFI
jgi:hypothetical protein